MHDFEEVYFYRLTFYMYLEITKVFLWPMIITGGPLSQQALQWITIHSALHPAGIAPGATCIWTLSLDNPFLLY